MKSLARKKHAPQAKSNVIPFPVRDSRPEFPELPEGEMVDMNKLLTGGMRNFFIAKHPFEQAFVIVDRNTKRFVWKIALDTSDETWEEAGA